MAKAKATAPTKAELEQFDEVRTQRLLLKREADSLERQEKRLAVKILAWAEQQAAANKPQGVFRRLGYLVTLCTRPGRISWKDAFVEHAGDAKAAELAEAAAAELVPYVEVKRAA